MADGLESMMSVIPVIVMGGVAMKFAEWIPQPKPPRRKKKFNKRQSLTGLGNFRNVGF